MDRKIESEWATTWILNVPSHPSKKEKEELQKKEKEIKELLGGERAKSKQPEHQPAIDRCSG